MSDDGKITEIYPDIQSLLESIDVNNEKITCDSLFLYNKLVAQGYKPNLDINNEILSDWRKNKYTKLMNYTGLVSDKNEYISSIRDFALKSTRESLKSTAARRDELVAQAIHAIDDLQKTVNLTSNRLNEMYGLHFPELVDLITNPVTLAKIIIDTPNRDNLTKEVLLKYKIPDSKIELILSGAKESLGGDLTETDLEPIVQYARSLIQQNNQLSYLENWIDKTMTEVAPNLTAVAGANVGARLIAAMGSLRSLAMRSSSKIQIIGAEKSLYSAMKHHGPPPKHGIIFQIAEIGNAPYWIRGKLSRAFAGKIAIAARLDEFKGEFLGDKMREELRSLEQKLRQEKPTPPTKQKKNKKKKKNKKRKKRDDSQNDKRRKNK